MGIVYPADQLSKPRGLIAPGDSGGSTTTITYLADTENDNTILTDTEGDGTGLADTEAP